MGKKYFAIKNNKIVDQISVCPFSKERMDRFCRKCGYDSWFQECETLYAVVEDMGRNILYDLETFNNLDEAKGYIKSKKIVCSKDRKFFIITKVN